MELRIFSLSTVLVEAPHPISDMAWNLGGWITPSEESLCGWAIRKVNMISQSSPLQTTFRDLVMRVFFTLVLSLLAIGDCLRWTAMTIMIVPAYRIGLRYHLINLISSLAVPILGLAIPFGYIHATSRENIFSFFPSQKRIHEFFLGHVHSPNMRAIKQAVRSGSVSDSRKSSALWYALYFEQVPCVITLLEGGAKPSQNSFLSASFSHSWIARETPSTYNRIEKFFFNRRMKRHLDKQYTILSHLLRAGAHFYKKEFEEYKERSQQLLSAMKQMREQDIDRVTQLYETFKTQIPLKDEDLERMANFDGTLDFYNPCHWDPEERVRRGRVGARNVEFCFDVLERISPHLEAVHRDMQAYRAKKLDEKIGAHRLPPAIHAIIIEYGSFEGYISLQDFPDHRRNMLS